MPTRRPSWPQWPTTALAEVISRHPTRFAGLASFAPQSPKRAVKEMERAIRKLKLNGFIVNSQTNGEYFDDPKYWPILECRRGARPLHLHPSARAGRRQGNVPVLRDGFRDVVVRRGGGHACRAHDGLGRVRSLPEAEDLHRPHGRGRALLAVARLVHESLARRAWGALPRRSSPSTSTSSAISSSRPAASRIPWRSNTPSRSSVSTT